MIFCCVGLFVCVRVCVHVCVLESQMDSLKGVGDWVTAVLHTLGALTSGYVTVF